MNESFPLKRLSLAKPKPTHEALVAIGNRGYKIPLTCHAFCDEILSLKKEENSNKKMLFFEKEALKIKVVENANNASRLLYYFC